MSQIVGVCTAGHRHCRVLAQLLQVRLDTGTLSSPFMATKLQPCNPALDALQHSLKAKSNPSRSHALLARQFLGGGHGYQEKSKGIPVRGPGDEAVNLPNKANVDLPSPHLSILPGATLPGLTRLVPFSKDCLRAAAGCFGGHKLLQLLGIQDSKCSQHGLQVSGGTCTSKVCKHLLLRRGLVASVWWHFNYLEACRVANWGQQLCS